MFLNGRKRRGGTRRFRERSCGGTRMWKERSSSGAGKGKEIKRWLR